MINDLSKAHKYSLKCSRTLRNSLLSEKKLTLTHVSIRPDNSWVKGRDWFNFNNNNSKIAQLSLKSLKIQLYNKGRLEKQKYVYMIVTLHQEVKNFLNFYCTSPLGKGNAHPNPKLISSSRKYLILLMLDIIERKWFYNV